MIKSTKDYEIFKFREDNRENINESHVQKLINSIKAKNLLEFRPILCNSNMEVLDGQHRLLAAQRLGIDIYYDIKNDNIDPKDIILMNIAAPWKLADYLNFYCKNNYPEYIKLKNFMAKNNMTLKISFGLACGRSEDQYDKFKRGEFTFNEELANQDIENCIEVINLIKRLNPSSLFTHTLRFWSALMKIVRHPEFSLKKFLDGITRNSHRITVKASTEEYLKTFFDVYNHLSRKKISEIPDDNIS